MADRLIKMDYKRGKAIVMRTTINSNGQLIEQQVEVDLPETPKTKGMIRKVKYGEDGRLYETEEIIETPILKVNEKEEG